MIVSRAEEIENERNNNLSETFCTESLDNIDRNRYNEINLESENSKDDIVPIHNHLILLPYQEQLLQLTLEKLQLKLMTAQVVYLVKNF